MFRASKFLGLVPLLFAACTLHAETLIGHDMDVVIDPEGGTIAVNDRLSLPEGLESWEFYLHRNLDPKVQEGDARLVRTGTRDHLEHFRLELDGANEVTLRYGGRVSHDLEDIREGMGRARQDSRGIVSAEGVVLNGYSGWYPRDPNALQRFVLRVRLPEGWLAVSQGEGPETTASENGLTVGWRETQPQDDIYLIAAPFEQYATTSSQVEAQVYLRRPDPELAKRYLEATDRYLDLYSALIGPYPYAKFALVENFWETGYGMPSFTLLGPQVIRLPFIIHTSYPHEVLHNWWGNGVYVDYESGNWSEGLTAYLADHLLKEQRGRGADYRRDSLRAYADYVREANDFPLREFRGGHGSASQAIGYGKTLMVLHMLRRNLGDGAFVAGLRRFYRDNLFRTAGFDDLQRAMEQVSERDLASFFRVWTGRTGAPELALTDVTVQQANRAHILRGRIEQTQGDAPFPLRVPLVVYLEGGETIEHRVALEDRSADFELELPAAPVRVDADPGFDLFRALVPGESPPTLSALFGSEDGLILLPANTSTDLALAYRRLADAWKQGSPGWEIATDADYEQLPGGRPMWLLGWSNRFLDAMTATTSSPFQMDANQRLVALPDGDFPGRELSLALVREQDGRPLGWVASPDPVALPGLARKLPHYGKYSYLAFAGRAPTNRLKGQWPVQDTRLMVWLSDHRPNLTPPLPEPLIPEL